MILIIYEKNDKLNFEQINRYLNIDYEENKNKDNNEDNSKFYDEKEFLNDDIYEEMINKINPYLEKFGLIPYMYFKVKANDKKIKRRLINDTLKNENYDNHEKYLENKFAEYDYFYAIDVNFWNLLMNEGVEAPDYINNSRIAEEINIVTEEEKINEEIGKIIENKKREKNKNEEKEKGKKEEKEKNDKKKIKDNKTEENNDKEKIKNKENKNQEKEKNGDNKEIKDKSEKKDKDKEKNKEKIKAIEIEGDKINNIKEEKNNENTNNITEKNNHDINDNNKESGIEKNEYEYIVTKQGKLKKGLQYKKDFIVVCGQLYQILKTNYKQDYIIKLTKLETLIDLNRYNKNEEKKESQAIPNKEEKKVNDKDEKKIKKIIKRIIKK